MGILKTITIASGLTVEDAYVRIDTVSGSKQNIDVSLNYYVDQQSFVEGKAYLQQEHYSYVPSVTDESPNFIKQGYEFIKSLEEFEGAVDA